MLTSGFYNSKGGDRKYDAEQFGAMFNGLITDGVFAHYKDALKVTAGSGNRRLVVKPGRAWFNGTWTEVDDDGHSIYLMGSAVETTYFVYLAVNKSDRKNTIAWYSSIANNDPEKGLYFYLLAQVTVPGGATKISDSMITDTRGSDLCPYVTGIMETVSFEELVKRVCGDNWQDWLGVYEAGITTGVQNAVRASSEALSEVKSLKAYSVESEAVSYTWAKFEAIATGGGGFEWATDSVHTELADPPMPVYLFRDLSYADLGAGFKPSISLGSPYKPNGETTTKPVPASTQAKVWKEYPYFWEGGGEYGTEVLRYDDLQRVIVTSTGVATEKYRYRVSRLVHLPVTYEPGAYIGTVTADNATAYPRDGYKDGYWYMRFASKAEDVSFYYPGLSAKNVRDAIIEVVKTGGTAGGTAMSVIEVEKLPATGARGVMYVVKKPGDSDAVEYLWLDRWEKIGGAGSGQNPSQGMSAELTAALADYFTHVMPRFDDANGLAYVNAILTALGAEPRGEGGGSGGGEIPEEPGQPGGEGGGTTGDALPTDGLMAYFDLRNLGDKANVTVGTTKGVVATQGNGALYSWASQPITSSDEYGAVLPRGLLYNPSGQSAEYDMGDHFTMVVTTRGGPSGWNAAVNNLAYVNANPEYVTADGTAKAGRIQISGDKTSYNTQVYCIDGATQTMHLNAVEVCRFDGADYADFVRWAAKPSVGVLYNAGAVVAAAFYNRALTEAEIVEVQAFMKSLEVTA